MFVTNAVCKVQVALTSYSLKKQYLHISEILYSANHRALPLVWRFNVAYNRNNNSYLHVRCLVFSRKEIPT